MVEGNLLALSSFDLVAVKKGIGCNDYKRFNSIKEKEEHGVTLLHLLSEVQGL